LPENFLSTFIKQEKIMRLEDDDRQQLIRLLIDMPVLVAEQGRRQMLELAGLGQLTTTMTLSGDTFSVVGYESLTNINLNSERGVNYTRLQNLLAAGKWGEADDETAAITRKILGINKTAALYIKDINTFPCTDLRTIEQLWLKYSNKRFGFSQQKQLWESLGGLATVPKVDIQEDDEIFNAFKEKVGWTKDTSERNVPKGYFPKIEKWWNSYQPGWLETIFLRVDVCKADI
jgi:GUN4-like